MEGMKDYVNPVLLLIVIGLMGCRCAVESPEALDLLDGWVLALCTTGVVVNGALALSRALVRQASLVSVVWAVVFVVLGGCAWVLSMTPLSEEQAVYSAQARAAVDPLARDAEGETLLSRAAALGKEDEVRRILAEASPSQELLREAGLRAAEANKPAVLDRLARVGLAADAEVGGVSLLHAAAQNGAAEAMRWLLERGAAVNARDEDGATPLMHAALSGSVAAVKILLEYKADARLRDAAGNRAQDYARREELQELLEPPPAPQPKEK